MKIPRRMVDGTFGGQLKKAALEQKTAVVLRFLGAMHGASRGRLSLKGEEMKFQKFLGSKPDQEGPQPGG